MTPLKELLFSFVRNRQKPEPDSKSSSIFYKIVDSHNGIYLLQCINTKATFQCKIVDIVFDKDILLGLHPVQACYIGLEYSRFLKKCASHPNDLKNTDKNNTTYPISRYGIYSIQYQNRKGQILFINRKTMEKVLMDPRDIALSEELIDEFDASEAFYIGLQAGLKLHNPMLNPDEKPKPHLRIIK